MRTERVGFVVSREEQRVLRGLRSYYRVSFSDIFRLYITWLKETGSVPIGLPGSLYEIANSPTEGYDGDVASEEL